ncbi:MAG: sensor histidine kinase [Planctomycetia bacterium]|nr:sensor histidine kinase [Planctomycetia bacterium]
MKRLAVVGACLPALLWLVAGSIVTGEEEQSDAVPSSSIATLLAQDPGEHDSATIVRTRGVVTLAVPDRFDFAVENDSAGIWVTALQVSDVEPWRSLRQSLRPGDEVEVTGGLDRGGYAPRIVMQEMRLIGNRPLPEPQPADLARLFSGFDNCRRVELTGVVQGVRDRGREWGLVVSSAARRMLVRISKGTLLTSPEQCIDATVRFTGVVGAVRNSRGEFLAPMLWVGLAEDMVIVNQPPSTAFAAPLVPLDRIARYRFDPNSGHRLQTEGTVTSVMEGRSFSIQQGLCGVRVQTVSSPPLKLGDRVQVAGFLDMSRQTAGISDAIVQVVGHEAVPAAQPISPQEISHINTEARRLGLIAQPSTYDGCLVTFPARLVEKKTAVPGVGQLVLSSGDATLSAIYEGDGFEPLRGLEPGSELMVTGVMQVEMVGDEGLSSVASDPIVKQLSLLLRSPADVQVLRTPSWWTAGRLTVALSGLAAVLAGSLLWVGLLRRQVAATTERLASEMRRRRDAALEFDASLRERNRLAANLHDTLLQSLTGIDFQLGACRAGGQNNGEEPSTHLDVAQKMVAHAAEELRGSVWALRTMPVAGRSFRESLETIATQTCHGHPEQIAVRVAGMPSDVPQFVAGNLLLVAQEALHNAVHHAGARQIEVVATGDAAAGSIDLTVRDDGRGFTPGSQLGPDQGHFGLSGMRERIERLGGTLSIDSQPGSGTTVRAVVPTRDYDRQIDVGDSQATG